MHVSNKLLIVLGFLSAMFVGCSDKSLNQDTAKVDVALKIVADAKSDFAAVASTAEVKISAEGMPTLTQPLTVTSGGISGTITGIVAGPDRKFEVFVYNAASKLVYYGSSVGEVTVGGTANIAMTLYRTNGEGNAVINGTIESTNTPPTVSINSPANNAQFTLGSTITLAATATDADGTVSSVTFYNGSTQLFSDNSAPYSYNFTPTAAGTYSFTAVATDNAGASTTSATITVTVVVVNQTSYKINCGGSAISPFATDGNYSGGSTSSTTSAITITGITNPAPAGVYQVERYGNVTYTFPNLVSGASYTVRLHFAEIYWTASGRRRFNVAINGSQVLSNFDIYATAGAAKKAVVREFTASANSSRQIVIALTTITDNASICGIEIIPAATLPVITTQPVSQSGCAGTNVTLSVTATGATGYQWYRGTAGSGTAISGATSSSYSTQNAGSYYCIVTGPGGSVTSAAASVTVNSINIVQQPSSINVPCGSTSTCTFTVQAAGSSGYTYQWQWNTNGGSTYSDCPEGRYFGNVTTATLTTTPDQKKWLRCVITDVCGNTVTSATAILDLPVLAIAQQPAGINVPCGSTSACTFAVQATGSSGYTYQWQWNTNGGSTYSDCPEGRYFANVTTATLTTVPDQKKWLRCVISDACGTTVTSATATLDLPVLAIVQQPASVNVPCGSTSACTFSVQASGSSGYTYQWQWNTNGGGTYSDCPEGRYFANVTTATLTTTPDQNKWLRCVISDACGNVVTSATAALSVSILSISQQPSSVNVPCGSSASQSFSVQASGSSGYTYQWQWNTNGGSTYSNCPEGRYFAGTTTAQLTTTPDQKKWLRCVVTDGCGVQVISGTAVMSLPVLSVSSPAGINYPCGASYNPTFSVVASGTQGYTYQWQVSTDGSNFSDCPESRYYYNVTTATLTAVQDQSKWLRCVVSDACGNTVTSSDAYLYIVPCP